MLGLKIVAGLVGFYLATVAAMALAQGWLIFPRWAMGAGSVALPAEAVRLTLPLASGETLVGVRLPAFEASDRPLLVGFGGNAWDADALALYLRRVAPTHEIVTFHYRGYGPSSGRPSAQALLDDALAVHDHLATTWEGPGMVAVGLSLGAGPAAHLAARRPIAGAVLVTPFDSLHAMARDHYPWAPVGLLLRHRLDVAAAVAASEVPMAVIAAASDEIVGAARTAAVREAARNLVFDRVIEGAGHNDLYGHPSFAPSLAAALDRIAAAGEPRGTAGG